jgi:hypothetical protein
MTAAMLAHGVSAGLESLPSAYQTMERGRALVLVGSGGKLRLSVIPSMVHENLHMSARGEHVLSRE